MPPRSPWCAGFTADTYLSLPPEKLEPVMEHEGQSQKRAPRPALARNPDAMDVFSGLAQPVREKVLEKSRRIRSQAEMRAYVDSLVGLRPDQME